MGKNTGLIELTREDAEYMLQVLKGCAPSGPDMLMAMEAHVRLMKAAMAVLFSLPKPPPDRQPIIMNEPWRNGAMPPPPPPRALRRRAGVKLTPDSHPDRSRLLDHLAEDVLAKQRTGNPDETLVQ